LKVSTKGRYGLRALADLAVNSKGDPVSVASIAERQHISSNYLESIFSTLKKAGVIKSIKGVNGGYVLREDAQDIGIGDILRILEGDLSIIDSEGDDDELDDGSLKLCIEHSVWDVVSNRIDQVVNSMTLEDII